MKSLGRAGFGLLLVGSALAFAGCGDDDDAPQGGAGKSAHGGDAATAGSTGQGGAGQADGVWQCKVIGELCHEADSGSSGSGAAHECHELGHEGDGAACAEGFAGCVETCVDESAGKEPMCAALGELCHEVDDETGPLHECHELGHVNDKDQCAAEFDHCAEICLAARELLEEGEGAGGAGGAAASGGGAAGSGAR